MKFVGKRLRPTEGVTLSGARYFTGKDYKWM